MTKTVTKTQIKARQAAQDLLDKELPGTCAMLAEESSSSRFVPWAELELYIFNVPSKPESKISRCVDMVYDHLRSTGLFHEDAVLLVYTCSSEAPPFRTPDQNLHPKP